MNNLQSYLKLYFDVDQDRLQQISGYFDTITLGKGDYFLKEYSPSLQLGFVESGLLREYFIDEKGKEVTKWISSEGYFVVDLMSFYFNTPARWNIQTLTDTQLFVLPKDRLETISKEVKDWDKLEKLFVAKCFGHLENRVVSHISLSAEERYDRLFELSPDLFNQVPLQNLASMIGITPETFSRIRRQKAM